MIDTVSLLMLLAIGAGLATLVLLWVFAQGKSCAYRRLLWLTTFLTLDLILFGGFTRLTDSGLGCPDWPGCYAHATPFHASAQIHAAQTQLPTGPVTMMKAWIEMLHRYFAMAVGLLITIIMIMAWQQNREMSAPRIERKIAIPSPWVASFLFLLVCIQGAFGAWTVTLKLQPLIVTLHLLLAISLLMGLTWLANQYQLAITLSQSGHNDLIRQTSLDLPVDNIARAKQTEPTLSDSHQGRKKSIRILQRWAIFAIAIVFIQIALGGWVSSNYAVLACSDFPLCHGQWWPRMDFSQGFALWRDLGHTVDGAMVTVDALIAIHWVHRAFALVVLLTLVPFIYFCRQIKPVRRLVHLLGIVFLLQIVSGIANVILQWPLLSAMGHNGGAALLILLLVRISCTLNAYS